MIAISVVIAVLLDRLLGEPKRWHPLVGFGRIAKAIENALNQTSFSRSMQQLLGMMSWIVLVIFPAVILLLLASYFSALVGYQWLVDGVVLYLVIGYASLKQHALAVLQPLLDNHLLLARQQVAMIVSRDTDSLDEQGVRVATIESVLENGSDAIFAPLFWFVVGGLPAVIIYRLANTLDAMWGYKTPRFLYFGRFSARMDDIMNYLPSRLVACTYSLLGNARQGFRCWFQQAHLLDSPNGGVVMTSGAGSLDLLLGGDTLYHGEQKSKPVFGVGKQPENHDIRRSLRLIDHTLYSWCGVIVVITCVYAWVI